MSTAPADASLVFATEVARLLWPDPWEAPYVTRSRHRSGLPHRDAYLFPSGRRPRLMVPADVPGSASMLRRLGKGRSVFSRPMRNLLESSVHSRAFALARWPMLRVPASESGADSIEHHLADCFETEVRVGVLLGTARVNQKPVLQVFGVDGRLRGYAKVGHNDLTAALVRRETESLTTVGGLNPRSFRVPRVLHHGEWAGLEVLVISALATDPEVPVPPRTRASAMRELAHLAGTTTAALSESAFWVRMRNSVRLLSDRPDTNRLRAVASAIERRHGAAQLTFGSWHGDWGHWNMGMGDGILQLWDWERYDPEVPIGFDGLHFAAQRARPGTRHASRRQDPFLRSVPGTLSGLGVHPSQHDLTLRLYLLEIAVRYVDGLAHGDTPALRRRIEWVLSLLERLPEQPRVGPSEGRS